ALAWWAKRSPTPKEYFASVNMISPNLDGGWGLSRIAAVLRNGVAATRLLPAKQAHRFLSPSDPRTEHSGESGRIRRLLRYAPCAVRTTNATQPCPLALG